MTLSGEDELRDELASIGRALVRGDEARPLAARLLGAVKGHLDHALVGIRVEATGDWWLPLGSGSASRTRLERCRKAAATTEWCISLPLTDGSDHLGELMVVVDHRTRRELPDASGLRQAVELACLILMAFERQSGAGATRTNAAATTTGRTTSNDVERALTANEIVPHVQPIVDLQSQKIVAFDALLRWNRPGRGWVEAGHFLPGVTDAALLTRLDHAVLRRASALARGWIDRGTHRVRVNVKLSRATLDSADLTDVLGSMLREYRLPAPTIGIAVPYDSLDDGATVDSLGPLRALGSRLTVEHVGWTPVDVALLRELPIYGLKVDRRLVAAAADPATALRIRAVVHAARTLGTRSIAESVETEAQRTVLAQSGVDAGLGYLWAPALEPEVANSMLHFQPFARRNRQRSKLLAGTSAAPEAPATATAAAAPAGRSLLATAPRSPVL